MKTFRLKTKIIGVRLSLNQIGKEELLTGAVVLDYEIKDMEVTTGSCSRKH